MRLCVPWVCPHCFAQLGNERTPQEEALKLLAGHRASVHAPGAPNIRRVPCQKCGSLVSVTRLNGHILRRCAKRLQKFIARTSEAKSLPIPPQRGKQDVDRCPICDHTIPKFKLKAHYLKCMSRSYPHTVKGWNGPGFPKSPKRKLPSRAVILSGGLPSLGKRR